MKATTAAWHIERRSLHQKRTRQPDCDSGFKQPRLDPIYGSRQNRASSSSSDEEVSFVPSDEWPAEAGDSEVSELVACSFMYCLLHYERMLLVMMPIWISFFLFCRSVG